jgi:hypothetical protein
MPLPNVVIAGAPRCGTTSFFQWAIAHPSALGSLTKETRYLIDPGYPLYNERLNYHAGGLAGYARMFPDDVTGSALLRLEATPDYMYQKTALSILPGLPTRPRLVFILRNPVERIISLFGYAMHNVASLEPNVSPRALFDAARAGTCTGDQIIDCAVLHSMYHHWLDRWMASAGRSRVDVYFFDDLVARPICVMRRFCESVGINADFYEGFKFKAENQTLQVRSVRLSRAKRFVEVKAPNLMRSSFLRNFYRAVNVRPSAPVASLDKDLADDIRACFAEPNRQLARLLGRDLPPGW